MELILAGVYNFSFGGFGFSIIGIVTSILYLWMNVKQKVEGELAVSESTKRLMAGQMKHENAKNTKLKRGLWIVYIIGICFIGVLLFCRLVSLCRRYSWRNDLSNDMPEACGSWAEKSGCTRIGIHEADCTRPGNIPTKNNIIFKVGDGNNRLINNIIAKCVNSNHSSRIMSPDNLSDSTEIDKLIHITWTSTFFGFLDDMYMVVNMDPADSTQRVVTIQSQLRIGKTDFQ